MTARDRQREATIARLLEAARELFAAHGMENVSVTEIGRAAGVSPSLINAYFDGKAGLLYALVRETNAPQLEASLDIAAGPGPAEDRLFAVLRFWAEGDLSDPAMLAVMQAYSWTWPAETEAENRAERAKFEAVLADLLRGGAAAGEFRPDVPAGETAVSIFAIYTWTMRMAVFEGLGPDQCIGRLRGQLLPLLRPPGT
ncbi:TetR/AcrR family transcriptional regulator [Mangrovicoccus ximenensis]|uniref:TetR/AcrR family transcriptional regulator n=1 Tax=Mangrovicoccus ximenensis TaxID=1911570 RepID=UPI001375265E|nr:TetR/AcrR family transcriptional regulator [Mangrovicoccus ximenensis]